MFINTKDLLTALAKWPGWGRIVETPERLDTLEKRIAELEAQTQPAGATLCPSCSSTNFPITESKPDLRFGGLGAERVTRTCADCGYSRQYIEK